MRRRVLFQGLLLSALLLLVPLPCHRYAERPPVQVPEYTTEPLSEYDKLIKAAADSVDWDWRLLAAVVYHESRFHNQAQSHRGATGLMQIHSTRYTEEELLDPRRNLSIGARYLRKMQKMFPAASPIENLKFALAAFNLGDGRLRRLLHEAALQGADTTRWDGVAALLPEGHHTVSYVEKVLATYEDYATKYPL